MKLPLLFLLAVCVLSTGCNSLDNPLAGFNPFRTGHDGRVFNAQTGEYEWPKNATPRPARPAQRSATKAATPAPKDDGRPYDPQKGEFLDPNPGR